MCIFCDIIEGKIPSSVIYEDEQVMAFLDISQVTRGHTLVIPKKHVDSFLECDDETLAHTRYLRVACWQCASWRRPAPPA